MAQIKVTEFVKTSNHTKNALGIINTIIPDIILYIENFKDFQDWKSLVESFNNKDTILNKFLYSYFNPIFSNLGIYLKYVNIKFDSLKESHISYAIIKQNTANIPVATINIHLQDISTLNKSSFISLISKELSNIEEQFRILAQKKNQLLETISPNTEIILSNKSNVFNKITQTPDQYALVLFNYYKQDLKSLSKSDRDIFLKSTILPNYDSFIKIENKEESDAFLIEKKSIFLKHLIISLKELINGLI